MPMNDAYAVAVLADGPVGYWRLNERTHDEQVTDESGHNHHGRFVERPSLGEQGAIHGSANCSMSFVSIPVSTERTIPVRIAAVGWLPSGVLPVLPGCWGARWWLRGGQPGDGCPCGVA